MKQEKKKQELANGFTIGLYRKKDSGGILVKAIDLDPLNQIIYVQLVNDVLTIEGKKEHFALLVIHQTGLPPDQNKEPFTVFAFKIKHVQDRSALQLMSEKLTDELILKLIEQKDYVYQSANFQSWCDAVLMEDSHARKERTGGSYAAQERNPNRVVLTGETWGKKYLTFYNSLNRDFKRVREKEFTEAQQIQSPIKSYASKHLDFFFLNTPFHYDMRVLYFRCEHLYFKGYVSVVLPQEEIKRKINTYLYNNLRKCIIDKSKPYKGLVSFYSYGKVSYSQSEDYPNGMTFKEFKKNHPEGKFSLVTYKQKDAKEKAYYHSLITSPFVEITEDKFYDMYGAVPCFKQGGTDDFWYFFNSEGAEMGLYDFFFTYKDEKYYRCIRSDKLTHEELQQQITEFITQNIQ